MFSGIIQAVVPIYTMYESTNSIKYGIILPIYLIKYLNIGFSISNNGCCLTVIKIKKNLVSFHLIYETLQLTNMGMLKIGDFINIERSLKYHSELGGHLMTGHIDCVGKIRKIIITKNSKKIWLQIKNQNFKKYIFNKGSIGIEGVSLTINKVLNDHIRICLTPYTEEKTTLGSKKIGDIVNIEFDMIVKSIVNKMEKYSII